jgi:hypothetical protein
MEQLNKDYGSQLLVSAEVLREADENDHGAESLGLVQVKGRDEPIEIYRATMRKTRGLTRSVIALIVPPFPAASRPSKTTMMRTPPRFTQS